MGSYYTYLISSLPALNFGSRPPFGAVEFIDKCAGLVAQPGIELLRRIAETEGYFLDCSASGVLGEWSGFETALRNELARLRAGRKKTDAAKFVRLPDNPDAHTSHVAMTAYRSLSMLEAEKIMDQARWEFLDALAFGHYFDFDFLVVYILKLKILERWDKIQKADKEKLFKQAVSV
jgi:hypothetical protein